MLPDPLRRAFQGLAGHCGELLALDQAGPADRLAVPDLGDEVDVPDP